MWEVNEIYLLSNEKTTLSLCEPEKNMMFFALHRLSYYSYGFDDDDDTLFGSFYNNNLSEMSVSTTAADPNNEQAGVGKV